MMVETPAARILLVDDDEFILNATTRLLQGLGQAHVVAIDNATDALATLAGDPSGVDIVLCDLNMPHMDGIEFLRRLAALGFAGGLVLISGESARTLKIAEDLARAHRLHVLGVVAKPVRSESIADMLAGWHRRVPAKHSRVLPVFTADELQHGIDAGEVIAHFQPQVRLSDHRVVGVEALARWRHPLHGMIPPDAFISLAENSGLIDSLADRIINEALARLAQWRRQGLELRLALNVSMENLTALDFPDRLVAAITAVRVPPSAITVEVTESRVMQNPVASRDTFARLRLKKIALSIDDFGTGFASLTQLHDLPFDELKIDKSFVNGAQADATALAILETSVALGRKLGMTVVAEGVETASDLARVTALGCDLAQGYFIARPMPAEDVAAWIR